MMLSKAGLFRRVADAERVASPELETLEIIVSNNLTGEVYDTVTMSWPAESSSRRGGFAA